MRRPEQAVTLDSFAKRVDGARERATAASSAAKAAADGATDAKVPVITALAKLAAAEADLLRLLSDWALLAEFARSDSVTVGSARIPAAMEGSDADGGARPVIRLKVPPPVLPPAHYCGALDCLLSACIHPSSSVVA